MSEQVDPTTKPEAAAEPAKPAAPQKRSIIGTFILVLASLVVVAAGAFGVWNYITNRPIHANVGDCVTQTTKTDASDAKLVACDKPEAKNKVVGVIKDVPEGEFDLKQQSLCEQWPSWQNVVWVGRKGGTGEAWCLEPMTK